MSETKEKEDQKGWHWSIPADLSGAQTLRTHEASKVVVIHQHENSLLGNASRF